MANIETSEKLLYEEFRQELENIPLDVYYQTITSSQYTSNNVQFKVQSPGPRALLDCDVWVKYTIKLSETAPDGLSNTFQNRGGGALASLPQNLNRFSFRGGNVMQKCMASCNVQINNQSLNVTPHKYIDVLNRLYVSNDQSEHEFSASGGRFDEGNHGHRTSHVQWKNRLTDESAVPNLFAIVTGALIPANTHNDLYLADSWYTQGAATLATKDFLANLRPPFPVKYDFYNPGFDKRVNKFANLIRSQIDNMNNVFTGGVDAFVQFIGVNQDAGADRQTYQFDIYERLPIPLFKMYSNDGKYGVIPNIRDLQIQISWLTGTSFIGSLLHSNNDAISVDMYWAGITNELAEIYLRWYTPPSSMNIPMEISIPYHHIDVQSFNTSGFVMPAAAARYSEKTFSQYNMSLQAVPDLLLIYCKFPGESYTKIIPDDYNLEITQIVIDIDSSSGKLNSLKTIDLYNKWKKLLKHGDEKIIGFDEWRKYCCVAALKPDDIGLKVGPGQSNLCTLGISMTFRNWWNNPAIMYQAAEPLGAAAAAAINLQVQVVSIYYKYKLSIGVNGSAKLELQRLNENLRELMPSRMENELLRSRII